MLSSRYFGGPTAFGNLVPSGGLAVPGSGQDPAYSNVDSEEVRTSRTPSQAAFLQSSATAGGLVQIVVIVAILFVVSRYVRL